MPEQIIRKEIAGIQKFITCEKSEVNDTEKSIVGWGSRPTPDRDKELIEWKAWRLDRYKKNPVLLLSHNYQNPPVGKILWIKNDSNGLKFKAKFANTERGNELYELYKDGIMNAFSVGFTPCENGYIDNPQDPQYKGLKRVYKDVELLEVSCVAVPANQDALVEFVKSGKVKNKELSEELTKVFEPEIKTDDEIVIEEELVKDLDVETVEKVETTDNYVHVPAPGQEGEHKDHKIRTVSMSKKEGIQGKYCVDCKKMIGYMFDKEKFSTDEAKKWVEEHSKAIEDFITKDENIDVDDWSDLLFKAEKPMCPAEGGKFGKDNGKLDECKDCKVKAECKKSKMEMTEGKGFGTIELTLSDKVSEVLEGILDRIKSLEEQINSDTEKTIEKIKSPDGAPSIYDITNAVNRALSPQKYSASEAVTPAEPNSYRYIVDVYPTQYPSGTVVYSEQEQGEKSEYYRLSYSMDSEGKVTFNGTPEKVEQSWVVDRYQKDFDEDLVEKIGMVLSGRNRKLVEDAVTALQNLLDAAAKEYDEEDFELDDIEVKDFEDPDEDDINFEEIEESDEPEEEEIDFTEEEIKEVVNNAIKDSIGKNLNIGEIVKNTVKVMTGKIT